MKAALFARLLADRRARRGAALVTRLADGAQALVHEEDSVGDLVLDHEALSEVRRRLRENRSGPLTAGADEFFVRSYANPPRLLIVGAVHIAQALAPMAALAGFEVTVIDPRRAWATAERLPGVTLTHEWPDDAMARLHADDQTAVVTLSHDPKIDDPALIEVLNSTAFYIGALGSSRTHAKRAARLTEVGLGELVPRIHAPVGLDLGGRSPAEIAVSILAQIIQVRYRGSAS